MKEIKEGLCCIAHLGFAAFLLWFNRAYPHDGITTGVIYILVALNILYSLSQEAE